MKRQITFTVLILFINILTAQIINIPQDYPTIQEGINAANNGDTVLVDPGVYKENLSIWYKAITLASQFIISGDSSLINNTIIDGDTSGAVLDIFVYCQGQSTSEINGFRITNGKSNEGGGVNIWQAQPSMGTVVILKSLLIDNNKANFRGGGISATTWCKADSSYILNLQNVIIASNNLTGLMAKGGGLYCDSINIVLQNVTINNNQTTYVYGLGGGAYFLNSQVYLINTSIFSNEVHTGAMQEWAGGGLFFDQSHAKIINSLLYDNHPEVIFLSDSDLDITNTTISQDDYDYWSIGGFVNQLNLINSIIWPEDYYWQPIQINGNINISFCNIRGGQGSVSGNVNWLEGNIDQDPLFQGSGEHPFQISQGSPCIDAGTTDTLGLNLPVYDLRNNVRIWDGNGNGEAIIDMGAYEYGALPVNIQNNWNEDSEDEIRIYPNPCTHLLNIEFDLERACISTLIIHDQIGREVEQIEFGHTSSGKHILQYETDKLPAGIYFISINSRYTRRVKKIIKL